ALRIPVVPADFYHAQYKFYVYVWPERLKLGWSRDRLIETLTEKGVPSFSGSCSEIYRERAFERTGWTPTEPLRVAQELGQTSLMFLVHPTLTEDYIHRMCDVIHDVVSSVTA